MEYPPVPTLTAGDVQVWWARRETVADWHHDLLDPAERERQEALHRQDDRDSFVVGCALLRQVAAGHLRIAPDAVRVHRGCADCGRPHGKTRVDGLHLSLSHSGQWVVVAVSRTLELGIDIEHRSSMQDADSVARLVLSAAEYGVYLRTPEQARARLLLNYWVGKEAVLKATGDGLRVPLQELTLADPSGSPRVVAWVRRPELAARITLHKVGRERRHAACLAVIGRPARVVELDLPGPR
ncbi:MAG: 4-phosphopantetheinyl transferase [Mycobacterium sp.]|nr:4-phosphopantetheinyl transferase [Mycobacterium sp.]